MYAFSHGLATGDDAAFRTLLELGADPTARDQHGRDLASYAPADRLPALRAAHPSIFR